MVKIGKGGFSSVYAAKHKVDQQLYAIKKTVLSVPSNSSATVYEEMTRMLQEVRLFAAISHQNIVRYNHSWIEVTETPSEDIVIEDPEEEDEEVVSSVSIKLDSPFIDFAADSQQQENSEAEDKPSEQENHVEKLTKEQGATESK